MTDIARLPEDPCADGPEPGPNARNGAARRLLGYSAVGLVLFFVPFEIGGRQAILLDHAVASLLHQARPLVVVFALLCMAYGALAPWFEGGGRVRSAACVFVVLKGLGLLIGLAYVFGLGPAAWYLPEMLPFLFDKLVLSLALIVPLGALALVFLVGFGLLELVGVLMQPVMRPIWRTPGKSAIDAVASFVGSYSVGLIITDKMFRQGHYGVREAAIIATGFSTVSAPFMVVVAQTLGLDAHWNLYFWSALLVTFAVTAISARLPPLSRLPAQTKPEPVLPIGQGRWHAAWRAGLTQAAQAPTLPAALREAFLDGLRMTTAILPGILSVGLLGLLAVQYTPLFDILGVLLYPLLWLFGVQAPMAAGSAIAAGLAEMFLPAVLLSDADLVLRFAVAVTSVSSILFLSASIPCILATRMPLSLRLLLTLWLQRTWLSLLLVLPLARLLHAIGCL